ncbi:histamine H2 receptor-like [Oculina patagonica]
MEQTQDTRSPPEVIIHTVILAATTLLSLIGNSLVCLAFYRNRRLRTVTNFYVLSLAVADIMVATFVFPFSTVASGLHRWPFNYNFCQLTGFIMLYWAAVSLWTLALTSINRYFCVVKPQRYSIFFTKKKTILSILSVWVYFLIFLPTFNSAAHVLFRWDPNILVCSPNYAKKVTERVAYISFACISFILLLVVLFGYGRVYRVVRQHNRAIVPSLQHAANNQGTMRAQEIKTCRVLFAAVFGFCISWIPFIASAVLQFCFDISIPTTAKSIPVLFCFISAWINPIIYGVMNRAMRKEFQNILFCRKED